MESVDYVLISSLVLQGAETKIHLLNVSMIMMLFSQIGTTLWESLVFRMSKVARRLLILMETAANAMMDIQSKILSAYSAPSLDAKAKIHLLSQTPAPVPSA